MKSRYVRKIIGPCMDATVCYGVPWVQMAAMLALESGWGESVLATKYNNHSGMKWRASMWKRRTSPLETREVLGGTEVEVSERFVKYASVADCVFHLAQTLAYSNNYAEARAIDENNRFGREFWSAAFRVYSTDPDYEDMVYAISAQIIMHLAKPGTSR